MMRSSWLVLFLATAAAFPFSKQLFEASSDDSRYAALQLPILPIPVSPFVLWAPRTCAVRVRQILTPTCPSWTDTSRPRRRTVSMPRASMSTYRSASTLSRWSGNAQRRSELRCGEPCLQRRSQQTSKSQTGPRSTVRQHASAWALRDVLRVPLPSAGCRRRMRG